MRLLTYDFVCHSLDARRDREGAVETYRHLLPEGRRFNPNGVGPFVRLLVADPLPAEAGVYAVTLDSQVVYLGRARTTIRDRWGSRGYATIHQRNTFSDGQSTNCRINSLIGNALIQGVAVELWTHVTDLPDVVEVELERAYRPAWNVQRL